MITRMETSARMSKTVKHNGVVYLCGQVGSGETVTRENLALVADTSLSGLRVTRELDRIIAERGMPGTIVSDNGTEFTSMVILRWVQDTVTAKRLKRHRCFEFVQKSSSLRHLHIHSSGLDTP